MKQSRVKQLNKRNWAECLKNINEDTCKPLYLAIKAMANGAV